MPLYAFKCTECKETFERRMSVQEREAGTPPCPKCGGKTEPVYGTVYAKTSKKS